MTMWYVNRAAGIVAWVLLASSMLVGLLLSSRALGRKARPNWLTDLHRGLSGLAVVFVAVHVAGAIGDNFIHYGAADVLLPFASSWRPVAMAWGIVSMYMLVAVEGSSLLRKHVPKTVWRKIHYLSFPLFLTATTHAFTAGTDVRTTAGMATASLATAAIAGLSVLRIGDEIEKSKQPPGAGPPGGNRPSGNRPAGVDARTGRPAIGEPVPAEPIVHRPRTAAWPTSPPVVEPTVGSEAPERWAPRPSSSPGTRF